MLRLGETARGVVVIDNSASDKDLEALTNKGVAGIRFHMFPGGALPWSILETMAPRVHNFGWHIQLQLDGKELPNHIELIRRLSCPVLIDHVGKFFEPVSPVSKIFQMMRDLVENGAWVKLSAAYKTSRIGPPNFENTGALAKAFIAPAPERVLWASNWPHPGQNPRPDDAILMDTLLNWVENDTLKQKILVNNPAKLYGF